MSTRLIPLIIERDVRVLFSDAFLVAIMFANFAIDLFVTAATFGRLVTGQGANYFLFIAPGSNLITAMVAAFQSGRDVWREKYIKDLTSYLLTLPVQRPVLAFSRVLGGVVRSVIATFPGTLVIFYLYGILFTPKVFVAYLIVGLFSLGIVGLSMAVIRVLLKHRNVGHHTERYPALPILSQHTVLFSKRVSKRPGPDSIVEPYDMGHSGVPATVAHFIYTSPCWRFSGVDIDPCRTLTGLRLAWDNLLHLVLETLAKARLD